MLAIVWVEPSSMLMTWSAGMFPEESRPWPWIVSGPLPRLTTSESNVSCPPLALMVAGVCSTRSGSNLLAAKACPAVNTNATTVSGTTRRAVMTRSADELQRARLDGLVAGLVEHGQLDLDAHSLVAR